MRTYRLLRRVGVGLVCRGRHLLGHEVGTRMQGSHRVRSHGLSHGACCIGDNSRPVPCVTLSTRLVVVTGPGGRGGADPDVDIGKGYVHPPLEY